MIMAVRKQVMTQKNSVRALQRFEADPQVVYSIDMVAHLANVPRRVILMYYKHGLVSPASDPLQGGYYFDAEAIRALRQIEQLRNRWGINLAGTRVILDLMNEVEELRDQVRFLRG
jgi:DNA-binding transcriptional MerR regulator